MVAGTISDDELPAIFSIFDGEQAILLAVSGGPDSLALLMLGRRWQERTGWQGRLFAATVDHGLRPEARDEADMVATACARIGVPHRTVSWRGDKPKTGLQEKARAARYALLDAEATRQGCSAIATAHTLDDQAETVLMRIAHGSGIEGLAAMRSVSRNRTPRLLRPLLGIAKARLVATLAALEVDAVTDPSNLDTRFERVRWRKRTPLLAAAGLPAERLALVARRAAEASDALQAIAARFAIEQNADGSILSLSRVAWCAEPAALRRAILLRAMRRLLPHETAIRLERLETLEQALAVADMSTTLRRTLAGVLVEAVGGLIRLRHEPARRRGRPS